jgi:hypothetical protein
MSEAEWTAETNPELMLNRWLFSKGSERKFLLYMLLCGRRLVEFDPDAGLIAFFAATEKYLENQLSRRELISVWAQSVRFDSKYWGWNVAQNFVNADIQPDHPPFGSTLAEKRAFVACVTANQAALDMIYASGNEDRERLLQIHYLRDIFGNPFRPVALDPAWRTPAVTALAHGIYTDRRFDAMPILADALEEAGCTSEDILAHCRGDGPHVRGCWAVDLILGKT